MAAEVCNETCYAVTAHHSTPHILQAKRKYEKAHYDSERALDNYRKADADINLSRAEVEKVGFSLVCPLNVEIFATRKT